MQSRKKRFENAKGDDPRGPCLCMSLAQGSAGGCPAGEPGWACTWAHTTSLSLKVHPLHISLPDDQFAKPLGISLNLSFSRDSLQTLHMAISQGLSLRHKWKSISTVFHISVLPKCCAWRCSPNACILLSSSCRVQTSPSMSQEKRRSFSIPHLRCLSDGF